MIADKLILQTSSWQDFTNKLKDVSKKRGMRHMGNVYERLVQLYLQTNPKYKSILKNVWLLNEVSSSLKEKLNLPEADEGIDLIAVTNDNEYWAIQAKYRSNPNETLTMGGFGGLSTFSSLAFHTCKNISHGLVCTTTSNPPKKLNLLGNVGFETYDSWIGLDDFNGEGWQLIKSQAKGKIVIPKPFSPRPHSKKAIAKAYEHFVKKKNARGKLIMP